MADDVPTLLWCAFGRGSHVREAKFSLLSAQREIRRDGERVRPVVVTDRPDAFLDWIGPGGEIVAVDEPTLRGWRGEHDYLYRIKIEAFRLVLSRFATPTLLLDSDTFFDGSPRALLGRLSPGVSLMDRPCEKVFGTRRYADFSTRLDAAYPGREVPVAPDRTLSVDPAKLRMWISGVVGLHPADAGLLHEVLHLVDDLWSRTGIFNAEQFAFTHVLVERTRLLRTDHTVRHYWGDWVDPVLGFSRRGWAVHQYARVLDDAEHLPLDAALERLGDLRITPLRRSPWQRARARLEKALGRGPTHMAATAGANP